MIKRVISALLSVATIMGCLCLFGCSSGSAALEYNGYSVSEDMYRYWMISWKQYYTKNYSDVEDTEEFWNSAYSADMTYGEYLQDNVDTRVRYYLIGQYLFDYYDLKLDSESKETIQGYLDDYITYYGSKSACNKALDEEYGIDLKTLEKIYTYEEKYTQVYEYLFGTSGIMTSTAEELDEYYHNYYVRAKYVLFLKDYRYEYDEDGKRVTDSSGYYVTVELTDEEKQEVADKANQIYNDLSSGIEFDGYADAIDYYVETYMSEYYEDVGTNYPNGFYITADEYAIHTAAVTEAAFDMEIGEVRLVENESCYFIIKKYQLIENAYSSDIDSDQFSYLVSYCNSEKFAKYFEELSESVFADDAICSKYKIADL